ncbi:enoyl-CoA hydratase/isomerase family protein [Tamlana agarivorans]|uniref:Enoyl-CoA hydratase/isomerase family protein n=1 Tax=Pseudotamlana agarivorans TaxID=481183 RepID=A0ACC5U9B6_9FLAO|nr:enoyl-CoA hydratase/isomerase family protein [Tamlana agarivorans]MBU2950839.1 enoyl-CoA hydratase/isomerase family protein [Tamlana agarivorans]
MSSNPSYLIVKKTLGLVTISLNRPKANSYYKGFLEQISATVNRASADDAVKVILINSTSEKFFCAGADIKIFSQNTTEENAEMVLAARAVSEAISRSPKIVIAAVSGHCLGGGLELIMACDIRLGAEGNYLIGLPEVKLGLMPGNGGTPRMIDLLGASRAMELLVTGNNISPQKAYDFGLFNQLYPANAFEAKVAEYIHELTLGAGEAMAAIKKYVQMHKGMTLQESLDFETDSVHALYDTHDAKEGFLAFVEKRKPNYK